MRISLFFIILIILSGCSTRIKCECDCLQSNYEAQYKIVDENQVQAEYKRSKSSLKKKAAGHWGSDAKVADRYNYVKYAKDFKARTIINFENGFIRVETTDINNPLRTLKEVISTTLLSTQNPENVDLFSSRYTIQVGEPFLYNRVKDHDGESIRWEWRANRYAQHLIDTSLKKDYVKTTSGNKRRYYVTFKMKQDVFSSTSELNYASIVKSQAKRFDLDPALIFALIETESHFNPFATSSIPAYGLMQVVPHSAGRDAWEFLTKQKGQPTRNYLFNAKNNIELGTTYLHILFSKYLSEIKNSKSKELCVIAAYNTGSGNVLRSFHKDKNIAIKKINSLSSSEVYYHLRKKLPYKETRDYVLKVTKAKKRFST